jgi:hypothetical protein
MFFQDGKIAPGVFRDHGAGMSVDWSRYSTPDETQHRARKPEDNAVLELTVSEVRAIPPPIVEHSPVEGNRAHAEVLGKRILKCESC